MAEGSVEIYRGAAVITAFDGEELNEKQKAKLPKEDIGVFDVNAVFTCAEGEDGGGEKHDVKIELTHRELSGRMLELYSREDGKTATQMDVALASLKRQGIVAKDTTEDNLFERVTDDSIIGKKVQIRVTKDPKNDGTGDFWSPKAYFCTGPAKLSGSALRDRFAAFKQGRKWTPPKAEAKTAPAPAAPVDNGGDDMPF